MGLEWGTEMGADQLMSEVEVRGPGVGFGEWQESGAPPGFRRKQWSICEGYLLRRGHWK